MSEHFPTYAQWRKNRRPPYWPDHAELVMIKWLDAAKLQDDNSEDMRPVMAVTVGFVVECTPQHVVLAMDIFEDEQARDKTTIPAKMVKAVVPIFKGALMAKRENA